MQATVVPTVTTTVRNAADQIVTSVPYSASFHPAAVVSGSSGTPTGYVRFRLYGDGSCTTLSDTSGLEHLSGGAVDATDFSHTSTPGTLAFQATYQGNATYSARKGPCVAFTVLKVKPTVTTEVRNAAEVHVSTILIGAFVHDFVKVTGPLGTPTGTVTVALYSDLSCGIFLAQSSPTTLINGEADLTAFRFQFSNPRALSFGSAYSGDSRNRAATGTCEPFRIKAPPFVATAVRDASGHILTSAPYGVAVHDTVTVGGGWGVPTGTAVVGLFPNATCTGAASASSSAVPLAGGFADVTGLTAAHLLPGLHSFRAAYSGNTTYAGRLGACEAFTITKALPVVTATIRDASGASVSSVPVGTVVHPHAVVTGAFGTPTGSVTAVVLAPGCQGLGVAGSAVLSGGVADIATRPATATTGGTNIAFSVIYSGDSIYAKATPVCVEVAVTAAGTPPVVATPGPAATPGSATAPPGASPAASEVPGASVADSPSASASPGPSPASSGAASPGPSAATTPPVATASSGSDLWPLLLGVVIVAVVGIGMGIALGRRRASA